MSARFPALLLLAILLVASPAAAGVVLSSTAQEVAVPAGEGGALSITVENTYPDPITGTLVRISTVEDDDGSAPTTTVQSARLTLPPGARQTRIALPPAPAGRTERVDLRFEYSGAGVDRAAVLPGILVRFEEHPATMAANRSLTSTDAPGAHVVQTVGGAEDPLSIDEALQQAQASAAPTGTPGVAPTPAMTPSPAVLRQLNESPLMISAGRTLLSDGFVPASSSVVPISNSTVQYSAGFTRTDGRTASLEAFVDGTGASFVRLKADDYLTLPSLDGNATVGAVRAEAAAAGLPCTGTVANTTPDNTTLVSISFANAEGARASIDAALRNGTIASLAVVHPPSPFAGFLSVAAGFVVPVLVTILACGALAGVVVGASRRRPVPAPAMQAPARDRRAEAAWLIADADLCHEAGDDREACRLIGQAYRMLLSCEYGLEIEATDREVLDHLAREGIVLGEVAGTLEECSRVAFGRAAVSGEDYLALRRAVTTGSTPRHE
jgi:hypothetical protein